VSAIVGGLILAFDGVLMSFAPTRAYALTGFIIIDLALAGLVLARQKLGYTAALVWSTLQLIAMILDPLAIPGFTPVEAAEYLYGLTPQTTPELCPVQCPPFRFSVPILMILQLAIIATTYRARKAT
jgi:hypothetical protein